MTWIVSQKLVAYFSKDRIKYFIHLICFTIFFVYLQIATDGIKLSSSPGSYFDPIEKYGILLTTFLWLIRISIYLFLPHSVFNMLGILFYNPFREYVNLRCTLETLPLICFRVVTRGDYPDLVRRNISINAHIIRKVGLKRFQIEIVSDKWLNLPEDTTTTLIVVPPTYKTKTGALFKARALQYCLERRNNLKDFDWIVHLDEETRLTENSVRGIANFCARGCHDFGQGVITYTRGEIVNWLCTFFDSQRVANDMGKLKFQFSFLHRPYFAWKGSFMVVRVGAEKVVTFDHGLEGSITEDNILAMMAFEKGFTFDFIEGDMHESSPFSLWDYILQRKRWFQGSYYVAFNSKISWRLRIIYIIHFFAWTGLILNMSKLYFAPRYPLPSNIVFDFLTSFDGAVGLYTYIFAAYKQFSDRFGYDFLVIPICFLLVFLTFPIMIICEIMAVVLGILGSWNEFYVIEKRVDAALVK